MILHEEISSLSRKSSLKIYRVCVHRIARGDTINWPQLSPDLLPINFFLWNFVKPKVPSRNDRSIKGLKAIIFLTFEDLKSTYDTLHGVFNN